VNQDFCHVADVSLIHHHNPFLLVFSRILRLKSATDADKLADDFLQSAAYQTAKAKIRPLFFVVFVAVLA
jgi:hypothetical protein